jgi:hypothetical protein
MKLPDQNSKNEKIFSLPNVQAVTCRKQYSFEMPPLQKIIYKGIIPEDEGLNIRYNE